MGKGLLDIESLGALRRRSHSGARQDFFSLRRANLTPAINILQGRSIVNLFFEASTRTRTSFEIAGRRLGAEIISITASGSSVSKGESLVDTLNTLGAMRPGCDRDAPFRFGRASLPVALPAHSYCQCR